MSAYGICVVSVDLFVLGSLCQYTTHKSVCLLCFLKPLYRMCVDISTCLFVPLKSMEVFMNRSCVSCLLDVCVADGAVVLKGDFRQIWPH